MKVSELITILQQLDPDALVLTRSSLDGYLDEVEEAQALKYRPAIHQRFYYSGKYQSVHEGRDILAGDFRTGVMIW